MTTLREAAQQALEALEFPAVSFPVDRHKAAVALRAALAEPAQEPVWTDLLRLVGNLFEEAYKAGKAAAAEPKQDGCDHCNHPMYAAIKCRMCGRVTEPAEEPPCATQECMPSQCPNCASLEAQNTELDRKLAEMEAKLNNPSVDDAFRILAEVNRRAIDYINELERQVNELKRAEREACAQIADDHASIEGIAQRIAAEIRGQG